MGFEFASAPAPSQASSFTLKWRSEVGWPNEPAGAAADLWVAADLRAAGATSPARFRRPEVGAHQTGGGLSGARPTFVGESVPACLQPQT